MYFVDRFVGWVEYVWFNFGTVERVCDLLERSHMARGSFLARCKLILLRLILVYHLGRIQFFDLFWTGLEVLIKYQLGPVRILSSRLFGILWQLYWNLKLTRCRNFRICLNLMNYYLMFWQRLACPKWSSWRGELTSLDPAAWGAHPDWEISSHPRIGSVGCKDSWSSDFYGDSC